MEVVEVGAGRGCSRKSTLMRPWWEVMVVRWWRTGVGWGVVCVGRGWVEVAIREAGSGWGGRMNGEWYGAGEEEEGFGVCLRSY